MPYETFDTSQLVLLPLAQRIHDMQLEEVLPLDAEPAGTYPGDELKILAERIIAAKSAGRPVILMMGAHLIKVGLSRFIIDLVERGVISHIGCNGACTIHDYELARIGATTESVARYISSGQFGLWQETGYLNDVVRAGIAGGPGRGRGHWSLDREFTFPAWRAEHPRGGLPLWGARYGPRGHWQRHHPRAP